MAEHLDAIIIGTGQAGKPLAGALAQAGWRTAIIERGRVGGTCLIDGCTPTKTMIASARVAHLARRGADYGVRTGPVSVDMQKVRRRKREVVDAFSGRSQRGMERHETLELIFGEARFVGPLEIEVALNDRGSRRLAAEKIFINTGARPLIPSIPGLDAVEFLDSTSIMELDRVPERLVVLGGGLVGLEFGQMFRRFGAAVTVLDSGPQLLDEEDEDVAEAVRTIFREDGIDVHTSSEAIHVATAEGGGVEVRVRSGDGSEWSGQGSDLLVAVGRIPNTESLGLDRAGVETDEQGHIRVDERLETTVPGVYAMGDVAGSPPFTHIAYDDYRIVSENLLASGDRTTSGRMVPYTVFIDPQLGRVGLTEREARESGREVRVAKLPMASVPRAIEIDETRGFMKAVVDAESDRILGAAVLGVEGGEILAALQIAMMGELPYTAMRDSVLAHPTLAESLNNLFMTLD